MIDNITIKPLSQDLLDDYLNFFDNDAFADNKHWAACYCRCYHFDHDNCNWDKTTAKENRSAVMKLIKNGAIKGYLAYDSDKPIGWLNANHRNNYSIVSYDKVDKKENIGSLICFIIAKNYRQKGIARMLLNAACDGFKQQGFKYAEGYPVINIEGDDKNYHGPLSLYISEGFEEFDREKREDVEIIIMRKLL